MNRISTIDETILWMGMKHINILVKDITGNFHHVLYTKCGTFKCIKTGDVVEQPVGWIYLPKMDDETEQEEIEILGY